jgi:hypothetical protein
MSAEELPTDEMPGERGANSEELSQAKDFAIALGCTLVCARLIIGASVATYACVLSAAVDSRRQHLDEGGADR